MYVDGDFAHLWHQQHSHLCACLLSRTGYLITYCNCPIHLVSTFQIKIALSTTESEYIALSMVTCNLLPFHCLLLEIHTDGIVQLPFQNTFSTMKTPTIELTSI
jgi:hypothetical protein